MGCGPRFSITLMLVACERRTQQDPYDPSKMEFKSPAALITGERHTGSFATGDSLSMDATLKPLNAAQLKEVHLDTTCSSTLLRVCMARS
jgi:hypothetical protein